MKQGVLVYDQKTDRMDVRFNLEEYYGGLHCGTCMEVFVNNRWKPTRIEYACGDTGWVSGRHSDFIAYRIKSPDELKSWYLYLQDRLSGITCQT